MRIIAGKFRSRELVAPAGDKTRPTTDRAREALFNVLTNLIEFDGARVLDLFAGSGALAFEALSRGAASATLVERDRKAAEAIRKNAENLGVVDAIMLERRDVFQYLAKDPALPFNLLMADAPYDESRARTELPNLIIANRWLAPGGLCVIEHRTGDDVLVPDGAKLVRELKAGEASFTITQQ
jgi:16S rRNA (guanine966-N2)-methyltransferase